MRSLPLLPLLPLPALLLPVLPFFVWLLSRFCRAALSRLSPLYPCVFPFLCSCLSAPLSLCASFPLCPCPSVLLFLCALVPLRSCSSVLLFLCVLVPLCSCFSAFLSLYAPVSLCLCPLCPFPLCLCPFALLFFCPPVSLSFCSLFRSPCLCFLPLPRVLLLCPAGFRCFPPRFPGHSLLSCCRPAFRCVTIPLVPVHPLRPLFPSLFPARHLPPGLSRLPARLSQGYLPACPDLRPASPLILTRPSVAFVLLLRVAMASRSIPLVASGSVFSPLVFCSRCPSVIK